MTILLLLIAIFILAYQYQKLEDSPTQDILSVIIGLLLLVLIHSLGAVFLTL